MLDHNVVVVGYHNVVVIGYHNVVVVGYHNVASSPGPTQKLGKGPGVTCKLSCMCRVSILHNSS